MDSASKTETAALKSQPDQNVVLNGVSSDVSEEVLPDSVRNLTEDELLEQQKRLKKEGETTLIAEGTWRGVPQSQFRSAFPGCVRVINRRFKYTIMKFETHEQAQAALNTLRNDGFMERKPDVELQSERRDYKDMEGRKFDLLRLQVLGMNGKVATSKLKEAFPEASNIIYHNALVKSGSAIIIFSNEETARKAFLSSENLKLKDRDVAVVYCQYRANRGIRARTSSGRYQDRSYQRGASGDGSKALRNSSGTNVRDGARGEQGVSEQILQAQAETAAQMKTMMRNLRRLRQEFSQMNSSISGLVSELSTVSNAVIQARRDNRD
jgi:RNA recognition motif-containing protein